LEKTPEEPAVSIATHPELTDSQAALKELSKSFADSRLSPGAAERDRGGEFPAGIYREAAGHGLVGLNIPERFGGGGLGLTESALVLEELARVDGSFALTVGASAGLAAEHILRAGTEEQAARWLPLLTGGELGAWALTEPGSGSDAAALRSRAERKGDSYILNGSKMFISQGSLFSVMVLIARTGEGKSGISAFVVEAADAGRESRPIHGKLGMRSMDTAEVVFECCEIPAGRLLGGEGEGFSHVVAVLTEGRINVGAIALGLGQGALDAALEHSRSREAFGRPIERFTGIREQLADCAIALAAGRALVYRAARFADSGKDAGPLAAKAKLFSSEAALRVCDRSIQIHGGYGYIDEYPAHRFWRDARLLTIGEGTSEILRGLISRSEFA
jgi:alkylation response protein AidB-like acyl-CoA dehydrogenase